MTTSNYLDNLKRLSEEYSRFKKIKEQDINTISGLVDTSGKPVNTGTGSPEPQPTKTTWTDTAKSWDKWSQENPMTRAAIGYIPGVAQIAGAADVASSAIQGNIKGALQNLPGVATGATQKQLQAGMAAYDAYKQQNLPGVAKNALTVAAAGGNQKAAQAVKAIGYGQTAANLPQTIKTVEPAVKTLAKMAVSNQAGTSSGSTSTVQENQYRRLINIIEATERGCPLATQDLDLNLKNRKKAIDEYMYGPLDPNEPNEEYWSKIADEWNMDDIEQAKSARCGNCAAFDITDKMQDCIAQGIGSEPGSDAMDTIDAGTLGYCKFLKFKCAAKRTCSSWVEGGPIQD